MIGLTPGATVTTSAVGGSQVAASTPVWAKAMAFVGSVALPALGGGAGVVLGIRPLKRQERRMAILGWTAGILTGTAGLIAGLWLS